MCAVIASAVPSTERSRRVMSTAPTRGLSIPEDASTPSPARDATATATFSGGGCLPDTAPVSGHAVGASSRPTLTPVKPRPPARSVGHGWYVTIVELRTMVRMYTTEGATLRDIAERTGRTLGTVHRHLRRAGVEMRPPSLNHRPHPLTLPEEELRRTAALYEAGLSMRLVAAELGVSQAVVVYRLDKAGVPRRPRGETARRAGSLVLIPPAVEDEIVRLYVEELKAQCEVAGEVGVARDTVRRALLRRGVRLRDRSQAMRVWYGQEPGEPAPRRFKPVPEDAEAADTSSPKVLRRYVPAAPLVQLFESAARRDGGFERACEASGVSERLLYAWRVGERPLATWDRAEGVLLAFGRLWWEVYDPADAQPCETFSGVRARDVVGWLKAAEMAVALWEPRPAVGERVVLDDATWRIESWDAMRQQFWLCRADGHRQAFAPSRLEGL